MNLERIENDVTITFTIPVKILQKHFAGKEDSIPIHDVFKFQLDKWIKTVNQGLSCLGEENVC